MSQDRSRDKLYARPLEEIVDFRFDEDVASIFPDMINRSVPGYATVISLIGVIAAQFARPGTRIYDLGCSLGAATLAMRQQVSAEDVEFVAVDNSEAMIHRCGEYLQADSGRAPVDLVCADLQDIEIKNASVVVLNFTLQFIPVEQRLKILHAVYEGLNPGGVLILSEKIRHQDDQTNDCMVELHHAFKRLKGYSDLEISQKRQALENVLLPETLDTHRDRLHEAGFPQVEPWFQCLNFAALLARK
jgi:tRNA (cmo5U34)-methyltransferase